MEYMMVAYSIPLLRGGKEADRPKTDYVVRESEQLRRI